MALLHWRKFAFFDEEIVKDTQLNKLVDEQDNQDIVTVKLSCSSSGRGCLLLGDENGYVYIINKHLKTNSFRANEKYTSHVKQVPKLPVFITCGSDQDGTNPIIKLWDPEKTDKFNQPTCIKVIRANSGFTSPSQVTCIECSDNLSLMAVGYEDGTVVLFQDIMKRRRSKKSGLLRASDTPITGIKIFGQSIVQGFITTENEIFHARFSDVSMSLVQLDSHGCKAKCFCQAHADLLAVGRDNAVYFYQVDGRGPCLAFESEKILLYRFKTYLVIISRDLPRKTTGATNQLKNRRIQSNDNTNLDAPHRKVNLNIYDIKNKYIAHSSSIPEVQEVISDWGHLFVICVNGKIILFREKDTQTKLETLYRKNQFSLVIDIAKSLQYDEDALADIFKHYGDHLFRERDFDGSISQYIKTIGRLEPTFVIKRFLMSKRLSNLTVYLEALHQKGQAGPEHTRILLNCYSKLGNIEGVRQLSETTDGGAHTIESEETLRAEDMIDLSEDHDFASDQEIDHQEPPQEEGRKLLMPALMEYSTNGDERLSSLLDEIVDQRAIIPMVVLKILLNSKRTTLALMKDYLVKFLAKSNDRHTENLSAIDHYEVDTEMLRQKIDEFKNNQTIFHPSKCSACNGNLDLPSVHFLCNHCYHQNCFYNHSAENDECPICVTSNRKLLDEISSHETGKLLPQRMERPLIRAGEDVFNSMAELFGYGLLD